MHDHIHSYSYGDPAYEPVTKALLQNFGACGIKCWEDLTHPVQIMFLMGKFLEGEIP